MTKLISTKEAAIIIQELTGKPISQRQLRHEIQRGHLKAHKIANTYLIEYSALVNYKRRQTGKPAKMFHKQSDQ